MITEEVLRLEQFHYRMDYIFIKTACKPVKNKCILNVQLRVLHVFIEYWILYKQFVC